MLIIVKNRRTCSNVHQIKQLSRVPQDDVGGLGVSTSIGEDDEAAEDRAEGVVIWRRGSDRECDNAARKESPA